MRHSTEISQYPNIVQRKLRFGNRRKQLKTMLYSEISRRVFEIEREASNGNSRNSTSAFPVVSRLSR